MVPLHETYSRDKPSFWQEIRIEKRRGPRLKQSLCDHFLRKLFPSRRSLLLSLFDIFQFKIPKQEQFCTHTLSSISTIDQSYFVYYRFDNFIRNAHSQVSYHIPDNLVGSLFYLHSRYESLTFFQSPLFTPNQSLAPPSRIAPRSNTLFSIYINAQIIFYL